MKFDLAQYGGFSAGYTWNIPAGLSEPELQKVYETRLRPYADGRNIPREAIFGGWFIDLPSNKFYVFRFVDGEQKRGGYVTTNFAICSYTEICGKNIKFLLNKLTFTERISNYSLEIDLLPSYAESLSFCADNLQGRDAERLLTIPQRRVTASAIAQFELSTLMPWGQVKTFAPKPIAEPPIQKPQSPTGPRKPLSTLPDWTPKALLGAGAFVLLCIIAVSLFQFVFPAKPSEKIRKTTEIKKTCPAVKPIAAPKKPKEEKESKPLPPKKKSDHLPLLFKFEQTINANSYPCPYKKEGVLEIVMSSQKIKIIFGKNIIRKKHDDSTEWIYQGKQQIGKYKTSKTGWCISLKEQDKKDDGENFARKKFESVIKSKAESEQPPRRTIDCRTKEGNKLIGRLIIETGQIEYQKVSK